MDQVLVAQFSNYKYYLYQTITSFCNTTRNQTDADWSLILPGHLLLAIVGIICELNLASQGVN